MLKFVHRCTRIPLGLDLEGITILSLTIEMFTSGNFSKYSTFVQRQCRFKVGLHDNDVLQIIFVVLLVCVSWKTIEKRCAKFYDQLLCSSDCSHLFLLMELSLTDTVFVTVLCILFGFFFFTFRKLSIILLFVYASVFRIVLCSYSVLSCHCAK